MKKSNNIPTWLAYCVKHRGKIRWIAFWGVTMFVLAYLSYESMKLVFAMMAFGVVLALVEGVLDDIHDQLEEQKEDIEDYLEDDSKP